MSFSSIVLLLAIALILFGPEDLPVIARALGKIVYQVRKATDELTKEFRDVVDTPKNTLNKTLENMVNPTPPRTKIDSNQWEQEGKKVSETDLITYDEEKPETAAKVTSGNENPLSGLPEDVIIHDPKSNAKQNQE